MAARRKPRETRKSRREPLVFLAEQPRSFAYVDDEDEFEVPPIPSRFALLQQQVSLSCQLAPASSFDRMEARA